MSDHEGRGYGRPPGRSDPELTDVRAGTPAGELLRRYWQPVARATDATTVPRRIRLLGEDLVLFRDGNGTPGLLAERCCHRGTSLHFGKVEDQGIRCCYHGWSFAVDGTCLDQPWEPGRGTRRDRFRQPWYPLEDEHGLLFAYLGPPERQPALPRYDVLTDLGDDEEIVAVDHLAFGGPDVAPCNWFQTHENAMDPYHVLVLHAANSGPQFSPHLAIAPRIDWTIHDWGVSALQDRTLPDGSVLHRVTEVRVPNVRIVPTPTLSDLGPSTSVSWAQPIDETHTRVFTLVRVRRGEEPPGLALHLDGRTWHELSEDERRRSPGDFEAQVGQGPITLHSEERLATTDRGVSMVRRQFREQVRLVAAGGDPVGTAREPADALVRVSAGNYVVRSRPAARS